MSVLDRLAGALLIWAIILFICNPFLRSRKMTVAATACGVGATICWVIAA